MTAFRLFTFFFLLALSSLFFAQGVLHRDVVYEPSSAGILYPRDTKNLSGQIESFIEQSHKCRIGEYPSLIIVPGASYLYIGGLLADAYVQTKDHSYDALIIIAPANDDNLDGVAVFPGIYYRSLLGALQANEHIVSNIIAQGDPNIKLSRSGFRNNLFIDVQIPFIQHIFGNRDIVTLAVGNIDSYEIESIAESITKATAGEDVLYVIAANGKSTRTIKDMNLYNKSVCRNLKSCQAQFFENPEDIFDLQKNEVVLELGLNIADLIDASSAEVYRINNATGLSKEKQSYETYISAGFYRSSPDSSIGKLDLSERDINIITDYIVNELRKEIFDEHNQLQLPSRLVTRSLGLYIKITKNGKLISIGSELFSNKKLITIIHDVTDYIMMTDPVTGHLDRNLFHGATVEIILTSRPRRFLADKKCPNEGLVYLNYKNYSSMNIIEETNFSSEKPLRDLCLKAGLLYDCWQDDAAEVYHFETVSRRRRLE